MSNALAIATVTATLAQAVRTAAQGAVGGADVVIGRPEAPSGGTPRKVHVYRYQVTPNTAQRNVDLPTPPWMKVFYRPEEHLPKAAVRL